MDYYYKGILRLNGIWGTPTVCGMYMAVGALLCMVMAVRLWNCRQLYAALGFVLLCLLFEVLLVLTYSRASFLAFILATIPLANMRPRYFSGVSVMLFFAICVMAPSGPSRLASSADSDDPAVRNRLLLWESTSELILDNWLIGVHSDGYLSVHKAWYLPDGMEKLKYSKPVNAYLYIGAQYGVIVFALIVMISAFCVLWLTLYAWRTASSLIACMSGFMIVYCVGNIFSIRTVDFFWTSAVLAIVTYSLVSAWRARRDLTLLLQYALRGSVFFVAVMVFVVLGVGFLAQNRRTYSIDRLDIDPKNDQMKVVRLCPRNEPVLPPLIVVSGGGGLETGPILTSCFAKARHEVFYLNVGELGVDDAIEAIRTCVTYLKRGNYVDPIVVGLDEFAAAAFISATGDSGVAALVVIDMVSEHPISRFSPVSHSKRMNIPLLCVRTNSAKINGLQLFADMMPTNGGPVETVDVANVDPVSAISLTRYICEWALSLEARK